MTDDNKVPELKEILGSLILAAKRPMTMREIRRNLQEVAESDGGHAAAMASAPPAEITRALNELKEQLEQAKCGIQLIQVADGYKFQTGSAAGPWIRNLLNAGAPNRLSRPALETLAIIAYRQPVTRAEMESIRGVNVDHVLNVLMEGQLVRIVGRSQLPGRPMLYGTTKFFLEHFGLNNLRELPAAAELTRPKDDAPAVEEVIEEEDDDAQGDLPLDDAPEQEKAPSEDKPEANEEADAPDAEEDAFDEEDEAFDDEDDD